MKPAGEELERWPRLWRVGRTRLPGRTNLQGLSEPGRWPRLWRVGRTSLPDRTSPQRLGEPGRWPRLRQGGGTGLRQGGGTGLRQGGGTGLRQGGGTGLRRPTRRNTAGGPRDAAERTVLFRARLRVCVVVGLTVSVLATLVGGVAYAMLVHGQETQIQRELAFNAALGDPSGPPGCAWIFLLDGGNLTTGTVPPPAGFPLRDALTEVAASRATRLERIERNGTVYFVRTQPRGAATVQVIFDARYQLADRRSLLLALLLAAATGLLASVLAGLLMGRQAVAPLAEALARQRRFVADASHELRTPISQIHTRAQLMARRARRGNLTEQRAELEKLVGTTERLGEIVEELLLSARLAGAPVDREALERVDVAALAEVAVAAETDRAAERGVALALSRPHHPLPVAGIGSALRRVISELLANALAHTPAGGRIGVAVRLADKGMIEIVVADTGTGFEPADACLLFDRFHHGAGGAGRRFGLGLALLREVVTGHGGTIEARGQVGRGATFTVRLPAAPPEPSGAVGAPPVPRQRIRLLSRSAAGGASGR